MGSIISHLELGNFSCVLLPTHIISFRIILLCPRNSVGLVFQSVSVVFLGNARYTLPAQLLAFVFFLIEGRIKNQGGSS